MSRFNLPFTIIALSIALAGCGRASQPVAIPGPGDATIPRGALAALRDQWPGAEIGLPASAPCPTTAGPSALVGRGDFNGDGTEDLAVWLTASGTPHLAALFARTGGEFSAVEVGDTLAAATSQLEIARRSTTHRLRGLTVDSFFGLDTVVLRACDGARTAWFWTGSRFEAQPLAN